MSRATVIGTVGLSLLMLTGCQPPAANDFAAFTDVDSDGFLDVPPPAGVAPSGQPGVKVRIKNELGVSDLGPFAESHGVDPAILSAAQFTVEVLWTITYAGGAVQELRQTEPLGPFEQAFEVACHEDASLNVEILIRLPITGSAILQRVPIGLTLNGLEYDCGQTIEFRAFVNNAGELDETIDVL